MSKFERLKGKIEQIEKLLFDVKKELDILIKERQSQTPQKTKGEAIPSDDELKHEYENLYELFKSKNIVAIKEFINKKDKNYLKAFCRINNLPLDVTRVSKDKISDELLQWLAQRKAITQRAT